MTRLAPRHAGGHEQRLAAQRGHAARASDLQEGLCARGGGGGGGGGGGVRRREADSGGRWDWAARRDGRGAAGA